MRTHQQFWLGAFALAGFALAGQAQAQIKLPVFDPDVPTGKTAKVVWSAAKADTDFQHGVLVTATMNNDSKVIGTLVRLDRKNKGIYIRTTPGETPTLVLEKDMKSLEKAARPVGTAMENINNPEIHRTVIWNGDIPSVSYYAPNLSPGEVDNLHRLEAAENELARLQTQMDLSNKVIDAQRVALLENQRTRYLLNSLLFQEAMPSARQFVPTRPFIPLNAFVNFPSEAQNTAQLAMNIPRVDPVAYNTALQNLRQLQGLGFFQNGQLVAVSTGNK